MGGIPSLHLAFVLACGVINSKMPTIYEKNECFGTKQNFKDLVIFFVKNMTLNICSFALTIVCLLPIIVLKYVHWVMFSRLMTCLTGNLNWLILTTVWKCIAYRMTITNAFSFLWIEASECKMQPKW